MVRTFDAAVRVDSTSVGEVDLFPLGDNAGVENRPKRGRLIELMC